MIRYAGRPVGPIGGPTLKHVTLGLDESSSFEVGNLSSVEQLELLLDPIDAVPNLDQVLGLNMPALRCLKIFNLHPETLQTLVGSPLLARVDALHLQLSEAFDATVLNGSTFPALSELHIDRYDLGAIHGVGTTQQGTQKRGPIVLTSEQQRVAAQIDAAFDGVPFPGPGHRSLYQAKAADNYDSCDQSRDHKGRWRDIPRQQILDCEWALPHLHDPPSFQYYLPALMTVVLKEERLMPNDWLSESIGYNLQFDGPADDLKSRRCGSMTPAQLEAIASFLNYTNAAPSAIQQWHRMARSPRS